MEILENGPEQNKQKNDRHPVKYLFINDISIFLCNLIVYTNLFLQGVLLQENIAMGFLKSSLSAKSLGAYDLSFSLRTKKTNFIKDSWRLILHG